MLLLSIPTRAQITSMKLLTPDVGWAATPHQLFWTTNGGKDWKDIAPPQAALRPGEGYRMTIDAVFFLDSSTGWVVLCAGQPGTETSDFYLASSRDNGSTWLVTSLSPPPSERGYGCGTAMSFADAMHGWIILRIATNTAFSAGVLLATEDGGATWKRLPNPPIADSLVLVAPSEAWLAGGPGGDELYVTRDAGKSWQQISPIPPPKLRALPYPNYRPPVFRDLRHGSLVVVYRGPEGTRPALVVFNTEDGGRTWKPECVVQNSTEAQHYGGGVPATAFVDSEALIAELSNCTQLALKTITESGETAVGTGTIPLTFPPTLGPVMQMSFLDERRGWVLVGWLYSTSDGGSNWTLITPMPQETWRWIQRTKQPAMPCPPGVAGPTPRPN